MIADIVPCSFIDYPGELSAVVFTQGCDLRCRYCHNPILCDKHRGSQMTLADAARFLESRKGKLTAVTVTGGEPTLHKSLPELLCIARRFGFAIKLDTNGMRPDIVKDLTAAGLVDYLAVDLKVAPGIDAKALTGATRQGASALKTLEQTVADGIEVEARTTAVRGVHDALHLVNIAECLAAAGVKTWRLQPVESSRVLDETYPIQPPGDTVLQMAVERANALGMDAAIRRGVEPVVAVSGSVRSAGSSVLSQRSFSFQ